jgi:hypothetical protein
MKIAAKAGVGQEKTRRRLKKSGISVKNASLSERRPKKVMYR